MSTAFQRVAFQPRTSRRLRIGIDTLVNAIRPTLGPMPRYVAIEDISGQSAVEILDSGGVIARRIIELADRDADVGAMFLRETLCKLHDEVGDGTATAAVLFQSVFSQAQRYIAAGGNAMALSRHLERGMHIILDNLCSLTCPLDDQAELGNIARSVCPDTEIAAALAEIFSRIGEWGRLEFRSGYGRGVELEFTEGSYWKADIHLPYPQDVAGKTVVLQDAALLITDLVIDDLEPLIEILKESLRAGLKSLVIVAKSLSAQVAAFLLSNTQPDKFQAVAVHTPGQNILDQKTALEDIALLTGGRAFFGQTGDTLNSFRLSDLGYAGRAWAAQQYFGIVDGKGDPTSRQTRINQLQAAASRTRSVSERNRIQGRIGGLIDGGVTLWVGGMSEPEIAARRQLAERSATLIRAALADGLLPGAGVSLLACQPALQRLKTTRGDADERAAIRILIRALEEPCRVLIANAGYEAGDIMARMRRRPGYGFDAHSARVVDVLQSGILDVASVTKGAVHSAIASAALALTIDTIVHRTNHR